MSKDPAFLFYSSDFLTGTLTMTDEQVGKYIRLLCLQHQKGSITEKDMLFICKRYDEDIMLKFVKDDTGNYFNVRLKEETDRRKAYSESRSNNRKSNKDKAKTTKNISKSYVKHMENENENENRDNNVIINKPKISKIEYAENIKLTTDEHELLTIKFGAEETDKAINYLSDYKKEKGYKTKSDYLTLRRWVFDAIKKHNGNTTKSKTELFAESTRWAYELDAINAAKIMEQSDHENSYDLGSG